MMNLEGDILHLGGEMDIPINSGPASALARAAFIAEQCGYLATWHYGHSAISISGGDIPGYVVLDWFRPDAMKLVKIELWSCTSTYLDEPKEVPHVR